MKTFPYVFALLFIAAFGYLGLRYFELPTFFLLDSTAKTKGNVIDTDWIYGVKGSRLQLVTYEYVVNDNVYHDQFKAGQREGLQKVGDKVLVEYAVSQPEKNEIVGYFRNKSGVPD